VNCIEKQIINDVKKISDKSELVNVVRQLNCHTNIQQFGNSTNMETVLRNLSLYLLKQGVNIPSGGYYDLLKYTE